jgi:hypothetical protein
MPRLPLAIAAPLCALWILTGVLAGPGLARADGENRNLLPMGERESFTGNAGIAGAGSTGAVFFNPGALPLVGAPSISMTGTTLLFFTVGTDAAFRIDDTDLPYDASGFLTVPTSLVSTYSIGDWTLATSILVPEALRTENRATWETPNSRATLLQLQDASSLWLGLSGARRITDRLSAGVSVYGAQQSASSVIMFQLLAPADPTASLTSVIHSQLRHWGLIGIAGLHLRATDWLDVGLRVESPWIGIKSSGSQYSTTIQTGGEEDAVITEVEQSDLDVGFEVPFDFGLGVAVAPHPRVRLYVDGSFQPGLSYVEVDDAELGTTEVDLAPTVRVNAGAEIRLAPSFILYAGGFHNPSAIEAIAVGGRTTYYDYIGATGGVIFTRGRTRTGLGGYYMRGSGEINPGFDDPARRVDQRAAVFGGLITTSYLL